MFDDYTRLTEGQTCPVSFIESIEGEQISLSTTDTPQPFLISFFIEQCQHCRKAMQFIGSQIRPAADSHQGRQVRND